MAISATVNAVFNIDNKLYKASIDIPSSTLTADAPFKFSVTSQAPALADKTKPLPPLVTLMQVAVGGSGNVYVAVSPPMDVISGAIGNDTVQDLSVVVAEGTYDTKTGKFKP
ncbi:MAG: hypothetical protein V4857_23050 [Pseudomonadota bacterium]